MNRTPFTRNFGFTPDRIRQMKENAENNVKSNDKLWWFKQPENVKNLTITEPGVYKFDVLQFPLKYSYHPYFAKQKIYDLGENPVWFDREIRVHSFGAHNSVCKRSFGSSYNHELRTFDNDPLCEFMFTDENKEKKFYQKTDRTFNVFVIRLHPNSPLGNTDYEIMTLDHLYMQDDVGVYYKVKLSADDRDNINVVVAKVVNGLKELTERKIYPKSLWDGTTTDID